MSNLSRRPVWLLFAAFLVEHWAGARVLKNKPEAECAACCCIMLHMDKQHSPPTTKPPRVSVPLDDDVLKVFQRLAKAGNMSTGRAIAEWLADTVEAAEFMAETMERARAAPKMVMREMHAYALGLADETGELMRKLAEKGRADRSGAQASEALRERQGGPFPPSCNTGGKVPEARGGKVPAQGGKASRNKGEGTSL